jgi:recombination protein RecT
MNHAPAQNSTKEIAKNGSPKTIPKERFDKALGTMDDLVKMGTPVLSNLRRALPAFLSKQENRFLSMLMTECQRTPTLLDCTARSLFGGLVQVAQLGLELGGPAGQAYLLPFGDKTNGVTNATLVIGYKGFVNLVFRSQMVKSFRAVTVREKDVIDEDLGSSPKLYHKPHPDKDGAPKGYYAVVEYINGGVDWEYMTLKNIIFHRGRHVKTSKGAWWDGVTVDPVSQKWTVTEEFNEMAKKTCLRKLSKRCPISTQMVAAASLDEQGEMGIEQNLGANVILEGVEGIEETDKLKELQKNFAAIKETATVVVSPTDPAPDKGPPDDEADKNEVLLALDEAFREYGTNYPAQMEIHGYATCGWKANKGPMPAMRDLKVEELSKFLGLIRRDCSKKKAPVSA